MNIQEHLLSCLAEECNEVAKECCKALRFGLDDKYRGKNKTPRKRLEQELNDITAVVYILSNKGIIDLRKAHNIYTIIKKRDKVDKYMKYAKKCGALKD